MPLPGGRGESPLFESLWRPASAELLDDMLCGPDAPDCYMLLDVRFTASAHLQLMTIPCGSTCRMPTKPPSAVRYDSGDWNGDPIVRGGFGVGSGNMARKRLVIRPDDRTGTGPAITILKSFGIALPANNRDLMSALTMTGFIHQRFPERITLADIAAAAGLRHEPQPMLHRISRGM